MRYKSIMVLYMTIQNQRSKPGMADFFEALHAEGVSYAVLRNYDTLPANPDPNGDVDLLISENKVTAFQKILQQWALKKQGRIFFTRHRFHCVSTFIFIPGSPNLATWIDAFTMMATRGVPWLEASSLLSSRVRHSSGFFILSPGAEAATLFIKEILAGSSVRTKYQERIVSLLKEAGSPETFVSALSIDFGETRARLMLDLACREQWDQSLKEKKHWWRALLRFTFRKEPLRQMKRFLQFFGGHIGRAFFQSCRGGIIAVLGPDGVGKTTACRNLQTRLKKWPFRKVYYYHGEFGVFPQLGKVLAWFKKPWRIAEIGESSRHQKAGPLRAFIHLIYYGLEFFLAWPWVLWGNFRGYCFIFDRFYYDFAIRGSHHWLYRLIIKIIPRPKLIILLKAPSALVYQRKQELTVNQIEEQLQEFQKRHQNAIIISTEQTPEEIISQMEKSVAFHFSKKNF